MHGALPWSVDMLYPLYSATHDQCREGRATAFAEAFSGGVFLAASLLDLIPDSFEDFGEFLMIYAAVVHTFLVTDKSVACYHVGHFLCGSSEEQSTVR